MRIKIIKPIKNFNREECGEVVLTGTYGTTLEFTSEDGEISYISKQKLTKLKTHYENKNSN